MTPCPSSPGGYQCQGPGRLSIHNHHRRAPCLRGHGTELRARSFKPEDMQTGSESTRHGGTAHGGQGLPGSTLSAWRTFLASDSVSFILQAPGEESRSCTGSAPAPCWGRRQNSSRSRGSGPPPVGSACLLGASALSAGLRRSSLHLCFGSYFCRQGI